MTTDWFRNTTWNDAIEQTFEEKLRRARMKEQYLRIQACTLSRSHPEVALKLLDRYFEFPNTFDHAQAHVDRATALLAVGRVVEAIVSYEDALARESGFPQVQTQARLDLPYLIAASCLKDRYDRALQILQAQGMDLRLDFPVDCFRWHAARALIAADSDQPELAREHAEQALEAAALERSGFRYHPTLGLVTEEYDRVIRRLRKMCSAK